MNIIKTNLKFKSAPKKRKKTTTLVLHCTATPEGKDYTVEQIHQWHLKRGWIGCGYNFIIARDGTIYEGRFEECSGAHTEGYNSISIGVSYVGGTDKNGKAKDTRTIEQKEAMYELIYYLMGKYPDIRSLEDIKGHYQLCGGKKLCPSFKMEVFREEYLKWIDKKQKEKRCDVKDWFK